MLPTKPQHTHTFRIQNFGSVPLHWLMTGESSLVAMGGGGRLIAVTCVGNGTHVTPCGRCRQLLWEHGGAELLVEVEGVPTPMNVLLPAAFPEHSNFENPAGE